MSDTDKPLTVKEAAHRADPLVRVDVVGFDPGQLVFRLPIDRPGYARALVIQTGRRQQRLADLIARDTEASTEELAAAFDRAHAASARFVATLLDASSWRPDALRRYTMPDPQPACPVCGDDRSVVVNGERRCGSGHAWTHDGDAGLFLGESRDTDFGLAVIAELAEQGMSMGQLAKIATWLNGCLVEIAGIGGDGGGVTFR